MMRSSDSIKISVQSQDVEDFDDKVRRGELGGCVVIPNHFERDIESGKQGKVEVLIDGSNVLNGNVIIKY